MPSIGGYSSIATLAGAMQVNTIAMQAAVNDVGGKLQGILSAIAQLQTLVSASFASGVTFSGLSAGAFSALPQFVSTGPV